MVYHFDGKNGIIKQQNAELQKHEHLNVIQ